jgi:monofunctional biosynthetic peptidoglycan transglycosylase
LGRILLVVSLSLGGWLAYEYWRLPDVSSLERRNPQTTALMRFRDEEYRRKGLKPVRRQLWVGYAAISDHLKRAVVLAEDAAFFSHRGLDFFELRESLRRDLETGELRRGASTITMQLARNLYLSPEKTFLRKLREIAIALRLERHLSKRRILEIYLNVVEWGPGIYGAEMAARAYFGKPAAEIGPLEAATLAALLPSPRAWTERRLLARRNVILRRMARSGYITAADFELWRALPLSLRAQALEAAAGSAEAGPLERGAGARRPERSEGGSRAEELSSASAV